MKKNILIIDDDKRLRELLEEYLAEKNYKIYLCDDFTSGKDIIEYFIFDLIIIDRMMPSGDGLNLVNTIKEKSNTPVILLTAMGETENKIKGLKIGADDYISKPFEPEELYLRIENLLKLFNQKKEKITSVIFGDYTFNLNTTQLQKSGNIIYLTEGENKLLIKLINKKNKIVLREELAEQDYDETELRKIDVQITRLRQKIELNPKQPHFIKTIRGKGYKLVCNEI